jgi:SRSO17 transposase
MPTMVKLDPELFWIIDETGIPNKGRHSVSVARQYYGILGKQGNCHATESLSLALYDGQFADPVASVFSQGLGG